MSYMKRFLEDVMTELGADEITQEVLVEAQRRLDESQRQSDVDEINIKFAEAAAEDKKQGYAGETVPRGNRLYRVNAELQKLANRKPEPSFDELRQALSPDDNEKIRFGHVCSHCGGQGRVCTASGRWVECSKCENGIVYEFKTRKQVREEGFEICPKCGDIYCVEDYCRQCEIRAQERRFGVE